ncbi:phenylacetic acid degradation protein [Pseudorhodoferax aquiterrae]|uniref:Phenylacetic acid degradation protein n=1 Tax=Pseudorhodoferax aquiterrae TaxID=747304 RepID=A0ABQ3FVS0_9BURK|nr:hotdog domain-containing protein [Pseudorhodoferax aquiterrae]GHC69463.1 phenylacetic acid degradation protein [Pseudorhodoferax aquiterrae]
MQALPVPIETLQRRFVAHTPQMADIGLEITSASVGRAAMRLPDRPDWIGDPARGLLHPGPLIVLADSCCGLAVGTALTERQPIATLDLRMDYLRRAGPGQDLHCETHCYRMTPSVAFVRGTVWQSEAEQPVAHVQAAFMLATPARRPAGPAAPAAAEAASWAAPTGDAPVLDGMAIPYADYLGIRQAEPGSAPVYRLPFQPKLIGNPQLPALHGGVVAGFAESAATLHLIGAIGGAKFPKCIDFSIDYLRSGRPEDTYAACEIVRLGARVALVQVRCWQGKGPEHPITVARGNFLLTEANP